MIKPIIVYPDKRLRVPCEKVEEINDEIRQICIDMHDTMLAHKAVGLAANQIGYYKQIFVLEPMVFDGGKEDDPVRVFINPVIEWSSETKAKDNEGCLSFPGTLLKIERSTMVRINARNLVGDRFEMTLTDFAARAFLHEYDHLINKLFVDYVGTFQKKQVEQRCQRFMKKYLREFNKGV